MATFAKLARRGISYTVGGSTLAITAATTYKYNSNTEQGAGFRRQVKFWSRVFPVVTDYYIQTAQSSPYVKYHKWKASKQYENENASEEIENNNDDTETERNTLSPAQRRKRKELLNSLHEKHAPEILEVMLDLKGLYIKLGQVLSVTALPIPEQYRKLFRTLQSDVPGHEEFDTVVKPTLEKEFGRPLDEIFESIDPIPCGAASIGQAHKAILKEEPESSSLSDANDNDNDNGRQVIVKVQYTDAAWKVPADIQCVGDFLQICIWAGVVDEESSRMGYDEFSRQFLSELDYNQEKCNLETVHASSLDPSAPYLKHNVVVPRVFSDYCTKKVITMTYLPGPTMEAEARRQLELLGIDTSVGIAQIIRDAAKDASENHNDAASGELVRRVTKHTGGGIDISRPSPSWKATLSRYLSKFVRVDAILWTARTVKKVRLLSQAGLVSVIHISPGLIVSLAWKKWAETHSSAAEQAERLGEIEGWCTALFDVHGHQVFNLGLFNADPHPGNILVVEEKDEKSSLKRRRKKSAVGLIDYGQCKKLTEEEQLKVARLILSVANNESDEAIASSFRDMDIITSNDSTEFLAEFGRLMFGPFRPEHLQHSWHMKLHKTDKVLYFPKELSMVYRTSLLLRGLAVSLQMNYSIGEQWKHHAQDAVNRIKIKDV